MVWNTDKPVRELPENIRPLFRDEAERLYHNLKSNRNKWRKKKWYDDKFVVYGKELVERNPGWYSDLWWTYQYIKKYKTEDFRRKKGYREVKKKDSLIRRKRSERALERIAKGKDLGFIDRRVGFVARSYWYDGLFRDIILERLLEGVDGWNGQPPENEVRIFFGKEPINIDLWMRG